MRYLKSLFAITILILSTSCQKKKHTKTKADPVIMETLRPSLELVWQTDSLLTTCEAVLFDKVSETIYVANINSDPWVKDNNGFISTINTKGEITNLKWLDEGLSAPKGMGISGGKLYVNDIDKIVEIDIVSQKITNTYQLDGSPQLNDITIGNNGVVLASGSNSNAIYQLKGAELTEVAKNSSGRLNGLLYQKEGVYYLDSGQHQFGIFDETEKTFKTLTTDIGHGDGIIRLENGDFIISSWKGEVFYISNKDWSKTLLLDTQDQAINAADIDFIPSTQTLLVPTFFHNRVMAYKLNYK